MMAEIVILLIKILRFVALRVMVKSGMESATPIVIIKPAYMMAEIAKN